MVFSYEVDACLDGSATVRQQRDHVQQYENGGFHANVLTAQRVAFKRWLGDLEAHPPHSFVNTRQLDMWGAAA